jgi:hypothetical protein
MVSACGLAGGPPAVRAAALRALRGPGGLQVQGVFGLHSIDDDDAMLCDVIIAQANAWHPEERSGDK